MAHWHSSVGRDGGASFKPTSPAALRVVWPSAEKSFAALSITRILSGKCKPWWCHLGQPYPPTPREQPKEFNEVWKSERDRSPWLANQSRSWKMRQPQTPTRRVTRGGGDRAQRRAPLVEKMRTSSARRAKTPYIMPKG